MINKRKNNTNTNTNTVCHNLSHSWVKLYSSYFQPSEPPIPCSSILTFTLWSPFKVTMFNLVTHSLVSLCIFPLIRKSRTFSSHTQSGKGSAVSNSTCTFSFSVFPLTNSFQIVSVYISFFLISFFASFLVNVPRFTELTLFFSPSL